MKEYVIGLDIGTTCTKALVVDSGGQVVSQGSQGYRLISDGCRIEQRAEDWSEAAVGAIRQAMEGVEGEILAISLSTQGASTVAVDAQGNPLGNAWTWMDSRATKEAAELETALGSDYIYRTSGWKVNPALDAAKIRHMKTQPELAEASLYLSTLEWVNLFLTGNPAIDPTNAAIRQLFNVEQGTWDDALLHAAGVDAAELPPVLPTGAKVGELTEAAAAALGLRVGIPVFNGAHDQYCAAIGAGAVNDGDMLLSAGTTWVLMGIGRKPLFTESFIAPGKHPVEGLYGAMASLICSGASLQWFKNEFLPEEFDQMNETVAQRREKTYDLCYYPYLAGASYPIWQPNAKGAFTGINLEHDRFDFARAIMEGVAFGVKRAVSDFAANGTDIKGITIMGGAAKSPVWTQMIASVTGVPIRRLNQADVCAIGAAVIAACGVGMFESYEQAAAAMVHTDRVYAPNPEELAYYQEKFARFDRMWQCMQQYYAQA